MATNSYVKEDTRWYSSPNPDDVYAAIFARLGAEIGAPMLQQGNRLKVKMEMRLKKACNYGELKQRLGKPKSSLSDKRGFQVHKGNGRRSYHPVGSHGRIPE